VVASKNIYLFSSASAAVGKSGLSLFVGFNIPQNFLGRYLSISGSVCWNLALAVLHTFLNILYAFWVFSCCLPSYFFNLLYSFRAV
jgi:hypothetical protein